MPAGDLQRTTEAEAVFSPFERDVQEVFTELNKNPDAMKPFRRALATCSLPTYRTWDTRVAEAVNLAYKKRAGDIGFVRSLVIALKGMYPKFGPRRLYQMTSICIGFASLMGEALNIQKVVTAEALGAAKYSQEDENATE